MLDFLHARNLGLIRDAELSPDPGLTVITGETGAGKTLLLGALRLLLGEQADPSMVGPFGDAAQADGVLVGETELGVSRVIPAEGRSRSYLDGAVASVAALADRVGSFVEVVGQHDQLELRKRRYVLALIDSNLAATGKEAIANYADAWRALADLREEEGRLGGSEAEIARELDLAAYQAREIESAGFNEGDEAGLEQQQIRLRNAGEIRDHLKAAARAIGRIDELAGELVSKMRKVGELDASALPLLESSESMAVSASELRRDLQTGLESLVEDPAELALVEERLTLLGELRRKYGKTISEILAYGEGAARRAAELGLALDRAAAIDEELQIAAIAVRDRAAALTEARRATAITLEKTIVEHLSELGLDSARIRFSFEEREPGPTGADRVQIHFASHPGLQAGPIAKIASGGELSRLILAVSLATSAGGAPTLVFDEVDAGLGGAAALAMGRKLGDLARGRQVLCVTHLPQVAAFADAHYVITRKGSEAALARVEGSGRLEELSRMIAGLPESERGQQAAGELLELSGK